jgi:hypothetical protein
VLEICVGIPTVAIVGGVMGFLGLLEYTRDVGQLLGVLLLLLGSLIAVKWTLNARWEKALP